MRRVVAGIPGYVDTLIDDPFTSWFWSAAERATMRRDWADVARGRVTATHEHA